MDMGLFNFKTIATVNHIVDKPYVHFDSKRPYLQIYVEIGSSSIKTPSMQQEQTETVELDCFHIYEVVICDCAR